MPVLRRNCNDRSGSHNRRLPHRNIYIRVASINRHEHCCPGRVDTLTYSIHALHHAAVRRVSVTVTSPVFFSLRAPILISM